MTTTGRLAAERGYPPPQFPPEPKDGHDTPAATAPSPIGAPTARSKRGAEPKRARKK
jgi:hypothetical protein